MSIISSVLAFLIASLIFCTRLEAQEWSGIDMGVDSFAYTLYNDTVSDLLFISTFKDPSFDPNNSGAYTWNGNKISMLKDDIYSVGALSTNITGFKGDVFFGGDQHIHNGTLISSWDGIDWQRISDSNGAILGLGVTTMAEYKDKLYVLGIFGYTGGMVTSFMVWDGAKWDYVGDTINFSGYATASIEFNGELFIGGRGLYFDTLVFKNIAIWNDTNFRDASAPDDIICTVTDFAIHRDTLYCSTFCGSLYKLAGMTWVKVALADSAIFTIKSFNGNLYIGGIFSSIDGNPLNHIGFIKNDSVHSMKSGTNGRVIGLEGYKGNLYVGGYFSEAGGKQVNNLARWGSPIGINDVEKNHKVGIYPNPSNGVFTIDWSPQQETHLYIYNIHGQSVYQSTISGLDKFQIDLPSKISNGIYLLRVTGNAYSSSEKIVISR